VRNTVFRTLAAILCSVFALLMVPSFFYNACGLAGMQDCADGPKWALISNVLASAFLIGCGFFLSYRLIRRKGFGKDQT